MTGHIGFVGARCRPLVERLALSGHAVAWHAPEGEPIAGVAMFANAVELARALVVPRVAWLDLPTGFSTELAIQDVWPEFSPGDVIVDAGGGTVQDGRRRAASLASANIRFVDCCVRLPAGDDTPTLLMGGDDAAIRIVAPYADALAGTSGWSHCGPSGAGYHGAIGDPVSKGGAS